MNPVSGGWTSHRTKGDGDYEAQKRAAIAQAAHNDYIQGVQSVYQSGAGQPITDSRSKYGNVNIMPNEVLQGANSNFAQRDMAGNVPLADPPNQTGTLMTEASATKTPQEDPQQFETSALEQRIAMMNKGGMHNLNNISALYPGA